MRFMNNKKTEHLPPHKDTLVIIGNGFDLWQGLHTCYSEFRKYYLVHRDEIMKRLRIKKRVFQDEEGQILSISDVELIYGDPFDPEELEAKFWNTFEASLDKLDAERLNLFFGKDSKGLRKMDKSIRNANRILREAFCNWIATIAIDHKETDFQFGDNCLFINFNYTDTLVKRFHVKESDEFHIHGLAADKESIIFGHSTHPQLPENELHQFGGRFRGLYFVERILYETDKHVQDNIQLLCMFLGIHGVMAEEIQQVYVLGHSMGLSDIGYFKFLVNATRVHEEKSTVDNGEYSETINSMDELHMRLQYAIKYAGYRLEDELIASENKAAVARKFDLEQSARDEEFQKEFFRMIRKGHKKKENIESVVVKPRMKDAMWHISYYSEQDKIWSEKLMTELGCKNFRLYSSIEQCMSQ